LRAKLVSIATAVPDFQLKTEEVIKEAIGIFAGRHSDFERLMPVYANTGIDSRYSVRSYDWFRQEQGWPERTEAFLEGAQDLFRQAAKEALARADCEAGDIDTIVTISSTGIATPTIESRVMAELGFRTNVKRVPVFGLGCAGGIAGMALGARLAIAQPGSRVLIVVIELCTLAFRPDEMTKSNIIATALFGDGAAAAVLSTESQEAHGEIEHMGEHTWPDTLDVMGWRMDAQGFGAIFARSIPDLVETELRPVADAFLAGNGLALQDVDDFTFHPGGAKVIVALEAAFGLQSGRLAHERAILSGYGNMSAPTVLFVLERALRDKFSGRRFVGALGPGFTAGFLTMLQ
jgi:alkylresorcinol/alkylpyrone synthase